MKLHFLIPIGCILLSILSITAFGQTPIKTYDSLWKVADGFISKGLTQSALTEVKKIYQLAKKEDQQAQLLKSTVYMINLQNETRENNADQAISEIEKEIPQLREPARSILTSLLAGTYYNYYQMMRWKIYQRTKTEAFQKNDIATWATEDFHKKIKALYLQSVQNETLLKQTQLGSFDAIITKGNMRKLRPTLYDLLAFRALVYFSSDERDIKKPAYSFEINTASAFEPAADFVHHKFETKDTSALEYKALLTYQKLIAFHQNDKQPDALIDADIHRIQFVNQKSVHPDKDQLYYHAMQHLANQYASTPAAAQAWYLMAEWHQQKGAEYDAHRDTTNRYEKLKSIQICEKIIKENPDTEGGINAYNLLNTIRQRSLLFSIERVNVPAQPFRALVQYANIGKLYLQLIRATEPIRNNLKNVYDEKFRANVLAAEPIRTWQQDLPDTKDFQNHDVEIKIDALPVGEYFLIASTDPNLNSPSIVIGARLFYVSDISYVNQENNFFVLNRTTGHPLAKANVRLWEQEYDYKSSVYIKTPGATYVTDENGYFEKEAADINKRQRNYQLEITHGKDKLFPEDAVSQHYFHNQPEDKTATRIFLFTDRSIYRPGQTVFFKGITEKQNEVLSTPDSKINVTLKNANGEEVSKLELPVNEYGTFSGKFQLPQGTLNGVFSISPGNYIIRVEEYKRPKFYVEYEPVKKPYMVNDEIQITGTAMAYAGNTIDGAKVKYRVVRTPRFIYPWFYKGWFPSAQPMEITNGETITDKDGKFSVSFIAIPDLKIDKKTDPVFDYTLYADVTDLNGETRSGEKWVSVSYKSILLKLDLPGIIPADSLKSLSIRTENTNGEFEPANVNVKIIKLKVEQRLIRPRYWQRPDQFVMTRDTYIKNFPNDEYDDETDVKTWAKEMVIFERRGDLKAGEKFDLKNPSTFSAGHYEIQIVTKDKNNEEVKLVSFFELTDQSPTLNRSQYLWTEGSQPIEPGQKTSIRIGSSADNLFLINGETKSKTASSIENFSFSKLSQEKRMMEYTASEADRGGYGVSHLFVKHNRIFQYNETIQVPWTNKELNIEYATFRDKTLPGSKENWRVKITGYKKEKVAAEMLASMYDASLDQFYPHNWSKPNIWRTFYLSSAWKGNENFGFWSAEVMHSGGFDYKSFQKQYDVLREPSIYSVSDVRLRGRASGLSMSSKDELVSEQISVGYGTSTLKEAVVADKSDESRRDEGTPETIEKRTVKTQPRTNFNETAFFFPALHTNENGEIEFSFTMPDALTRWKFQALAHTKDMALGYSSKEIVTQKELMVQPNAPRFIREGDKLEFTSKVANLTDRELSGNVTLQLFDTETNTSVDTLFRNTNTSLPFSVLAKQSTVVKFSIEVPANFSKMITWRIVAKAGNMSDGEENTLPVIPRRMLVTETLPMNVRGTNTKSFRLDKLINSNRSKTLSSHSLTVEYTSNPAWYAIQALPYLMEYPYDCAEQTWNRYYANTLGAHIAGSSPRIAKVFETWRTEDTTALLSNLQKNQELKSVLLEETPWVLAAKTESEQKRNVALLFNLVRMGNERNANLEKLKQMQSPNGGFVWFKGGPDDRYITQYIVSGIGHLKKLKAVSSDQSEALNAIVQAALPYLDKKIKEDYDQLLKQKTNLKTYVPGPATIQYLYARSFFPDYKVADVSLKALTYFTGRTAKTWTSQNKYMQGMIALVAYRNKDMITAKAVLKSLSETAIHNEELGMYWKTAQSWWWHENPIERQALLIEAFQEAGNDTRAVDDLRTWLLKNKQTNRWESTKATAEACYALLLQGTEWLQSDPVVTVRLGDMDLNATDEKQQAGTGYFQKTIEAQKITAAMGNIQVSIKSPATTNPATSWGAVYWQYFEDMDKITFAETPLKLEKKLFLEKNAANGPALTPITETSTLSVGDKVKVRIVLRVDREMEYVHMKDMRASAFEPVNVLSGYKWQGGLGYYESTKDASTNFFFSHLNKGTYVFEYPLFVTHAGDFSNGITTIQCMYAPEFTAHSEGVRVKVGEN